MPLSVRAWVCPECGAYHDRDVNAAKNIRDVGASMPVPEKKDVKRVGKVNPARKQKVSSIEESTGGVPESQARGESGQQDASVKREPGWGGSACKTREQWRCRHSFPNSAAIR